jgi:hypothetical protein
MTETMVGRPTGGKPIMLHQLQDELGSAGVTVPSLVMANDMVGTADTSGNLVDFPVAQHAAVDGAIAAHVAMRDKTDAEYATEFQDAGTTPERKQEIRDITAGLLPRDQVPM